MSWYNPRTWGKDLAKRSAIGISEIPDKVFVNYDGQQMPGGGFGYEYSELPPPNIKWDIDDILFGAYGRQNFITLFYSLPEIFAPVNEIASRVSDAVWELRKFSNDEVDYSNKNFNRLFEKPNPLMSHKKLVWQAECYELLTGANFQFFNKPATLADNFDNIITWSNLPTQKVCIHKNRDADFYTATTLNDLVKEYELNDGYSRKIPVNNVLPSIDLDLNFGNEIDKFRSQLEGAKLAIKNLIPVYEARGVIYIKRGALGFLVSKKSDASGMVSLTPKEKEEAQITYQQTYGLTAGKNQVGVTAAPLEYIPTSMSIQELQPFDETLADAIAIYAALRVPRHLVPSKDRSTFSNANADLKSFYDDVIIPRANRRGQSWTSYFKIPARYVFPNFSHISILQENRKEKSEVEAKNTDTWLKRWQAGACTLNDFIVSFDGDKGVGGIYDKKLFDLTPEELEMAKKVINLKSSNNNITENGATQQNTGTQEEGGANNL